MSASQNHIPPLSPPRLPLLLISPHHPLFSLLLSSPAWPRLPPCVLVWSLRLCGVSGRLESPARTLYLVPVWPPCHIINRCSTSSLISYLTEHSRDTQLNLALYSVLWFHVNSMAVKVSITLCSWCTISCMKWNMNFHYLHFWCLFDIQCLDYLEALCSLKVKME